MSSCGVEIRTVSLLTRISLPPLWLCLVFSVLRFDVRILANRTSLGLGHQVNRPWCSCVINANLPRLLSSLRLEQVLMHFMFTLALEGIGGCQHWETELSVILRFGGTPIKAYSQWQEEVSFILLYRFLFLSFYLISAPCTAIIRLFIPTNP